MKEITILPARFKNRVDRDRARVLLARKVMWELLAAAKSQVGPIRWINEGALELEEFAEAMDTGRWHPWHKDWEEKKKTAPNRAASARERLAQHLMYLATVALERAFRPNLSRAEARKIVAKKAARVFEQPPTTKAIAHWQENQPPLSAGDEQALAIAISSTRVNEPGGRDRLVDYFIGIAHSVMTPGTLIGTE